MLPLSVAIIAKDEADRIASAIQSVPFAAEVVVVESGSGDATVEVAQRLGAVVHVTPDFPGHVAQKNRALALCSQAWVLCLDADERVSDELAASVRALFEAGEPQADGYRVSRLSTWLGQPIRHGTWYPDARIRLVRRAKATWKGRDPHDLLHVDGKVDRLRGDVLHDPYRSLSEHVATIDRYSARAAEVLHGEGVRATVADVTFRPPLHLAKALLLNAGFRDGVPGLAVAGLGATYVLLKWVRLWLRQRA